MEKFTTHYAPAIGTGEEREAVQRFLRGVYGWMGIGLAITAMVAWAVSASPALTSALIEDRMVFYGLLLTEFVVVVLMTRFVDTMPAVIAGAMFVFYSAISGATFGVIALVVSAESLQTTFFVTAASFGSLAVYGTVTQRDLDGIGRFLFMGLIGLVLAGLVQLWWPSDGLRFVRDFVGVIVFAGLTAWDGQRLRKMASVTGGDAPTLAINGALALYLDFVNLFLHLLGGDE